MSPRSVALPWHEASPDKFIHDQVSGAKNPQRPRVLKIRARCARPQIVKPLFMKLTKSTERDFDRRTLQ